MRFGRFQVEIFSDGTFKLDGGSMFGVVPKVLWEKAKPADALNRIEMDMNCLLIRDADHVVVVETGAGTKLTEKQRHLLREFAAVEDGAGMPQRKGFMEKLKEMFKKE